ncbi:MAG: peptidase M22 [Clostridia bacterium]|nr:peptidase M22 [Clostridia bacterium]
MKIYLGVDTSNYTTSAAFYDADGGRAVSKRRLLPVKPGEKGIRQSDAVFHHTAALPEMIRSLAGETGAVPLAGVGASDKPSNIEGSYMPCFTVGSGFAASLAALNGIPAYYQSHQHGHIAAALFGAGRLDLLGAPFLAFHVSGGTTEAVFCRPDEESAFTCERILYTTDLKAGQAIDRTGVMLGLPFPAGKALDALSLQSDKQYRIRPSVRDGCPSLSGVQNKVEKMMREGEKDCDIALFCIESVAAALLAMRDALKEKYPGLPVVYSGGVTANTVLRRELAEDLAVFAPAEYAGDNAVGAAVLAAIKDARR